MKSPACGLSIQQLQTFCSVYQLRGYAAAAEQIGLAPPTMWEQIRLMEKLYRTRLFERTGRSIRPTSSGVLLYNMLQPLLANIDSTFQIIDEQTEQDSAEMRLIVGTRMMLEELGRPLGLFHKRFPATRLRFMTADNRAAQQQVLDGHADVALMIEPTPSMLAERICIERLYRIEYLAVLPPRHRLIRHPALKLADIIHEPLVMGTANTIGRQMFEQAAFRLGLPAPQRIVAEADNSAVTIACVRAGLGIGIIAGRSDGKLTQPTNVRSLADELGQVQVVAASRAGRHLTRTLRALLDLLKQ